MLQNFWKILFILNFNMADFWKAIRTITSPMILVPQYVSKIMFHAIFLLHFLILHCIK